MRSWQRDGLGYTVPLTALTGWASGQSFVNSVDDVGVLDPAQVNRGDPEISVTELALDDHEQNAFGECGANVAGHPPGAQRGAAGRRTQRLSMATARTASTQNAAPTGSEARTESRARVVPKTQRSIPTSRRLPPFPCLTRARQGTPHDQSRPADERAHPWLPPRRGVPR